jgi:hypothetical protein
LLNKTVDVETNYLALIRLLFNDFAVVEKLKTGIKFYLKITFFKGEEKFVLP